MKRILTAIVAITLMLGCIISPMTALASGGITYELYIPGYAHENTCYMNVGEMEKVVPYFNLFYPGGKKDVLRIEDGSHVTFSSSKQSVATISQTGWLIAKSTGTTTITVKSMLNKDVVKFKVKVTAPKPTPKPTATPSACVSTNNDPYTDKYKVVYSGGLYINEKCNRANSTKKLMRKNEIFYVDPTTAKKSGKYIWAKAKYGNITGWWVCIGNSSWCKKVK